VNKVEYIKRDPSRGEACVFTEHKVTQSIISQLP